MSINFYLFKHVYKGAEDGLKASAEGRDPFDEVDEDSPLWRAVSNDCPLVHVCLASTILFWAMKSSHVESLAMRHSTVKVFKDEYGRLWSGNAFWEYVGGHHQEEAKIGEWFS